MKKVLWWIVLIWVLTWGALRWIKQYTWIDMIGDIFASQESNINDTKTDGEDHPHDGTEWSDHHNIDSDSTLNSDWVLVVSPKFISQDEISEKNYIWTIYSPNYGQVYPLREWIIESLYVDTGDKVKKGQVIWKLTTQTFAPDLADMKASRQSDITVAQWWVQWAQLRLDMARQAKSKYQASVQDLSQNIESSRETTPLVAGIENELDSVLDQIATEVAQIQWKVSIIDKNIALEKSTLELEKKQLEIEVKTLQSSIDISKQKLSSSIRFAYDQIVAVFYPQWFSMSQTRLPTHFGAQNTSTTQEFKRIFMQLSSKITGLESMPVAQQSDLAIEIIDVINLWTTVLQFSITDNDYTETQLRTDKDRLVDAKIDDVAGISSIWWDILTQQIEIEGKKAQVEQLNTSFDLKTQTLDLEKEQLLQEIETIRARADTEIISNKNTVAEKKRELLLEDLDLQTQLQWQKNDIMNTLREYDKDITEAQVDLRIAQAELSWANQALGILQTWWFNNNIVAPFSGTITKRFLTVGNTVSAEKPIFDLVDSGSWSEKFVRFDVPEAEYDLISLWQKIKFLRVQDPVRHYTATVTRVADAIDEETNSILVEAQLDEENEKILIWWTAIILFEQTWDVSLVPLTAVIENDDWDLIVWKVVDDIIVAQTVETGKTIWDQIYITSWLNEWDSIVSDAKQVVWKETWDSISVIKWFQASEVDQWLDALGDGHDHEH